MPLARLRPLRKSSSRNLVLRLEGSAIFKRSQLGALACLLLSLIGAAMAASLVSVHIQGKSGSALLMKVCGGTGGGCDKVIDSRWAYFPPSARADGASLPEAGGDDALGRGPESAAPSEVASNTGVPVAAIGLCYFASLAVWFAVVGRADRRQQWMNTGILGLCGLGCLASLFFIVIMVSVVRAWCPLCLGSHVANFLLLGSLVASQKTSRHIEDEDAQHGEAAPAHPTKRLALTAVVLAAVLCFGLWSSFQRLGLARTATALSRALDEYTANANAVELAYFQQPTVEINIRDDDPIVQASAGTRMTVVIFSDIECRYCAAFDRFLFEEVKPLFDGHLRIVFKHFPNTRDHANAFEAAAAVEAAREQGRFWDALRYLAARREQLGPATYEAMATEFDLDLGRFNADLNSQAIRRRIQEDIQEARRHRCTGAPTVFFNKRKLDTITRELLGFWELRRDGLKRVREARGQGW